MTRRVCPGLTVYFIDKKDVKDVKKSFDEDLFTGCKTLPGTRKMHHMEVVGKSQVETSYFKGAERSKMFLFKWLWIKVFVWISVILITCDLLWNKVIFSLFV